VPRRRICLLGSATNTTNTDLVRSWRGLGFDAVLLSPLERQPRLEPGTVALGRLDVLPSLDGVEPGLLALFLLERGGVRVLNRASALIVVHDKLLTARRLAFAGLPHPRTAAWRGDREPPLKPPLVLKPRFGSWGRDVFRCRDEAEVTEALRAARDRPWFVRHGALLQELMPLSTSDLRLVVAGGAVVGAGRRVATRGEWRTNVSLGGRLLPARPSPAAQSIAIAAATAVGADLVGVDLLPLGRDEYVVIELNGAVEFDERYSLTERGIHLDIAGALGLLPDRDPCPCGCGSPAGAQPLVENRSGVGV